MLQGTFANSVVRQTSQVHHPTWHCIVASLPAILSASGSIQNTLPDINCCCFYHTLGLLLDPAQNMDIPAECYCWPDSILDTWRRGILLCDTDLQHDTAISDPEQATLPTEVFDD